MANKKYTVQINEQGLSQLIAGIERLNKNLERTDDAARQATKDVGKMGKASKGAAAGVDELGQQSAKTNRYLKGTGQATNR
jgi:hypothetical protein